MYIVMISLIKLALLFGIGTLYFLGLGWWINAPLIHKNLLGSEKEIPVLREIPLVILLGLILNYGIVLVFQELAISLLISTILAILGLCFIGIYIFRQYPKQQFSFGSRFKWVGILAVCLLFLAPILTQFLITWDARSIWFFHAKMIFEAGSIGLIADWTHPSVAFSHPDYPKFLPALVAQIMHIFGFWNEYLPKNALLFIYLPAIFWLFTFAERSYKFLALFLLMLFNFYPHLWDGLLDSFLALYFSLAMLLLGRYLKTRSWLDLASSLVCLIFLLYLKNEGALAFLSGLLILVYFIANKEHLHSLKKYISPTSIMAGLLMLMPFVLWNFYKSKWGLDNDLGLGTQGASLQILERIKDGSYLIILRRVYLELEGSFLILGLITVAAWSQNVAIKKENMLALMASGIYCLGIIVIYLLTPHDLVWHMDTSVARIMFLVQGSVYVTGYFMLDEMDSHI